MHSDSDLSLKTKCLRDIRVQGWQEGVRVVLLQLASQPAGYPHAISRLGELLLPCCCSLECAFLGTLCCVVVGRYAGACCIVPLYVAWCMLHDAIRLVCDKYEIVMYVHLHTPPPIREHARAHSPTHPHTPTHTHTHPHTHTHTHADPLPHHPTTPQCRGPDDGRYMLCCEIPANAPKALITVAEIRRRKKVTDGFCTMLERQTSPSRNV